MVDQSNNDIFDNHSNHSFNSQGRFINNRPPNIVTTRVPT